jgi:hypothetical protein
MWTSKEDSPLVVELLQKVANTYNELDDSEKAIELYNYVIAIIQRTLGLEHESLVVPFKNMVYLVLDEGRFEELELAILRFCNTIPLFYNFFIIC